MSVELTITAGPGKGRAFTFAEQDIMLLGRSSRCHCCIGDDLDCSRVHCMIEVNPPQCFVRDLGSTNGTFVNGKEIGHAEIRPGDVVRVGQTEFGISTGQTSARPHAAPARASRPAPRDGEDSAAPGCLRCGKPLQGTPVCLGCREEMREIGETVPGYRLLRMLNEGGMGVIWEAKHTETERRVAVKMMRAHLAATPEAVQLFVRESRISLGLRHAHIVEFIAAGEFDHQLYIVMEYVNGQDAGRLRERLGGRMPERDVVHIGRQVLDALIYAHQRDIVHRDLKPENLLISGSPGKYDVKVTDFGLAKNFRDAGMNSITRQGDIRGSVLFMPPEQVIDCRGVDHRADIFSLASTMYHLLTGAYAFDFDPDHKQPLLTIVEDDVTPIERRGVRVSPRVCNVINRGLRKDPAQRYQSAREMRHALG